MVILFYDKYVLIYTPEGETWTGGVTYRYFISRMWHQDFNLTDVRLGPKPCKIDTLWPVNELNGFGAKREHFYYSDGLLSHFINYFLRLCIISELFTRYHLSRYFWIKVSGFFDSPVSFSDCVG